MNAEQKIQKARTGLVLDAPFWGALSCRLKIVEDPTCETAWTDGQTIGYNPEFVDGLTLAQTKGLLAHETAHPALQHHTRRGTRDASKWNEAADYAINPLLIAEGFELPPGALIDATYSDLSAEQIYTRLTAGPEPQKPESGENGDSDDPQEDKESQDSGAGGNNDDPNDDENAPDAPGGDGTPEDDSADAPGGENAGEGDSGDEGSDSSDSGGGDSDETGENGDSPADPGECGEVRDAPAGDPGDEGSEDDWKNAVQAAQNYAQACGKMGGGMARAVAEILAPVIDWKDRLRDFIEVTAKQDYTWSAPNRRHVHAGLFLPGCQSEELPPVAVCVDTSGSINDEALDQFAGELAAILADYPDSRMRVIFCDDRVEHVQDIAADDCELKPAGGGGTEFTPAFDAVEQWTEETGEEPAAIIYFTDLVCWDFPEVEPEAPVMWLQWADPGCNHYDNDPPFGEVVKM